MKYPQLIFCLLLNLLIGCTPFNKDEFKVKKITGSPSFYLPVAFGNLSLKEILKKMKEKEVSVETDAGGLLYLQYIQSKKSNQASSFITLKEQEISRKIDLIGATLPANGAEKELIHSTESFAFDFAPKRLKEIKFKSTTLAIKLNDEEFNNRPEGIDVEIKIPGLSKDGVPFIHREPFPVTKEISLKDYVMTLDDNRFTCEITLIEKIHTEEVRFPAIKLTTRLRFASIDFSYLKGYFGDFGILIPNIKYDLEAVSSKLKEGDFYIKDPFLEVDLYNGFGAFVDFTFHTLEVEDHMNNKIPLQTDRQMNPLRLDQPAGLNRPRSITSVKVTNSQEAFGKIPKFLKFYSSVRINRDLDQAPVENFCSDTSTVGWRFLLKFPLYGNSKKSHIRDTVAVDVSQVTVEEVQEATLTVNVTNQLPMDVLVQIYLSDNLGGNFEKLLTANNQLVKSSEVNSNGELTAVGVADKEIPIDKEVLKKLTAAKKIIFEAEFATGHPPNNVQFKAYQSVKVQLGIKTALKVSYVSK